MPRTFTAFHVRSWSMQDRVVVRVEDVRAGTSAELTGSRALEVVRLLRAAVTSPGDADPADEETGTAVAETAG